MQKKIFAWAMSMAVAAMITCTGCTQNSSTSSGTDSETAQTTTLEETDGSVSSQNLSAVQSGTAGVTTDADDLCDTYDSFDAEIALADDDTKVTGNTKAVSVKNNRVTISAGGTYRISGKLTKGQVVVTGLEKVKLYLDGAEITSPSGPALVCVNEKRTVLSLAKGTKNVLTDSADNAETTESRNNVDACALFAQDKLTINGSGSLAVSGNSRDGIVCKDTLKLVNGTITVDAAEDGVKGKDCVAMFGADLTVTAGNDGVKSTEDSDAAKGFLQLTDGSAAVTAGGDCLQAESLVWVTDGTYTLTSNGTAVDAETGETSSSKGVKCSGDVEIAGGTLTIDAAEDGVNCGGAMEIQDGEMTVSSAEDGIQADGDLTISGGTVQVTTTGEVAASAQDDFQPGNFGGGTPPSGEMPSGDAPSGNPPELPDGETFGGGNPPSGNAPSGDVPGQNGQNANAENADIIQAAAVQTDTTAASVTDAADSQTTTTTTADDATSKGIKCGGNLVMSGGSCTIHSTDHAVHAAGTAELSGTTLYITSDNKGISSHGNLTVSDGSITIHSCTEGIESKAEMNISGGEIRILDATDDGLNTGGADSGSHAMTISGGYIYVNASGDGVDSNGTWTMTGGTLLVCGPTSGGDGSLDANGDMTYTGGTLLALSSKGMMEYSESGCLVATNCNAAAGDQISIVDQNGTVLVTLQSPKAVSDVIYGIGDGDSSDYTIVTGGTYSGTLNDDGYAEGGTVSGGTEVTANGGSGGMNGGQPDGMPSGQPGGQGGTPPSGSNGGTPPEKPGQNSTDSSTENS